MIAGVIETFDARRGDGTLRSDSGRAFHFHCVMILDGSREIPVGARAQGERAVGRLGRDEVVGVRVAA